MGLPFAADGAAVAAPRNVHPVSVAAAAQASTRGLDVGEPPAGDFPDPTVSGHRPSTAAMPGEFSGTTPPEETWPDGVRDVPVGVGGVDVDVDEKLSRERNDPSSGQLPDVACLSRTICAIKDKIRWGSPAWTPTQCHSIASAVLSASKRYSLSPSLLLAVMINESDLNEKAARITMRENKVYAKDSGLMAIRCVLDRHNRCLNGNVRGVAWSELMKPANNIAAGARELAYWRSGGAVTKTVVKLRDASGKVRPVFKNVPCRHKDHAYWAHYNHGPYYIAKGNPRHYPHRVAVIDYALASVLNVDAPELKGNRITIHDPGKRQRTADRPLEARYRKLCTQIQSVGACSAVALN